MPNLDSRMLSHKKKRHSSAKIRYNFQIFKILYLVLFYQLPAKPLQDFNIMTERYEDTATS